MFRLLCSMTWAPTVGGRVLRNPYTMFSTPVTDRILMLFVQNYAPDSKNCGHFLAPRQIPQKQEGPCSQQPVGSSSGCFGSAWCFPIISSEESLAMVEAIANCWWVSTGMPIILPHRESGKLVRKSLRGLGQDLEEDDGAE